MSVGERDGDSGDKKIFGLSSKKIPHLCTYQPRTLLYPFGLYVSLPYIPPTVLYFYGHPHQVVKEKNFYAQGTWGGLDLLEFELVYEGSFINLAPKLYGRCQFAFGVNWLIHYPT